MDFNSLKKASNLFEGKFVPKNDLCRLLDDSSERYILKHIPEPRKRKFFKSVIESTSLSSIRDRKLFIPSESIIKEIVSHFRKEGVSLKNYEVSGSCITLTLASSKWFVSFIKPKMWFRVVQLRLNSEEQSAIIEYGFNNSFLDFAVNGAANYCSRPYIKVIEKTNLGGKISVDLAAYVQDFSDRIYIKNLDCSIFSLVSFSSAQHSMNGINLICDQDWSEIVNNMQMRYDVIEAQNSKATPSVWLIHKE